MNTRVMAGAAMCLTLVGCISKQNMTAAEAAAQTFYQRQAQGQADLIYNEASARFRNAITLQANQRLMQVALAASKGCAAPVRDPSQISTNASTSGYSVAVVYHRTCPAGRLDENFMFSFENGAPKLAGYHISGDPLMAAIAPTANTPPTSDATTNGAPATTLTTTTPTKAVSTSRPAKISAPGGQ